MAVIGFDVYGTLVDPLGMDAPLREHVGELAERFAATWRERQIDWTFRRALMGRYVDFDAVTRDAFRDHRGDAGGRPADGGGGATRHLPPSAGVRRRRRRAWPARGGGAPPGRLQQRRRGHVARPADPRPAHAPLSDVVSVDEVKTYKPSPVVYQHLVVRGGEPAERTWLVSTNAWDVLGAKSAGLRSAWVRRSARAHWDGGGIAEPDVVVATLTELADHLGPERAAARHRRTSIVAKEPRTERIVHATRLRLRPGVEAHSPRKPATRRLSVHASACERPSRLTPGGFQQC